MKYINFIVILVTSSIFVAFISCDYKSAPLNMDTAAFCKNNFYLLQTVRWAGINIINN